MANSVVLFTLLGFLVNWTPNLCDDVHLDAAGAPYTDYAGQTLSRYCEWTGPDAPVWDRDVCCSVDEDGASCVAPLRNGRCRTGVKMYCEYGEVIGGKVACYQPFPSMCDWGLCVQAPEVIPPGHEVNLGCCSTGGVCQLISDQEILGCQGYFLACFFGTQNEDGTVDCYD